MVTWYALLCVAAIIAGTLTAAYGAISALSSSRSDTQQSGTAGCTPFLIGCACIVGGVVGLFL